MSVTKELDRFEVVPVCIVEEEKEEDDDNDKDE